MWMGVNTIIVILSSLPASVGFPDWISQDAKQTLLSPNTWSALFSRLLSFELKPYFDFNVL